jgi:hypothetical protein
MNNPFQASVLLLGASCSGKTSWLTAAVGSQSLRRTAGVRFLDPEIQDDALRTYQQMFACPEGGDGWPEPTPGIAPLDLAYFADNRSLLGIRTLDIGGHLLSADPNKDPGAKELYSQLCDRPNCVVIVVPMAVFSLSDPDELILDLKGQLLWIGKLLERATTEGHLRNTSFVLLLTKADECEHMMKSLRDNNEELLRERFAVLPSLFSGDALTQVIPMSLIDRSTGMPRLKPRWADLPFAFAILTTLKQLQQTIVGELSELATRLRRQCLADCKKLNAMSLSTEVRKRYTSAVHADFEQLKSCSLSAIRNIGQLVSRLPREAIGYLQGLAGFCDEQERILSSKSLSVEVRRSLSSRVQSEFNAVKNLAIDTLQHVGEESKPMETVTLPQELEDLETQLRSVLSCVDSLYRGGRPISLSEI